MTDASGSRGRANDGERVRVAWSWRSISRWALIRCFRAAVPLAFIFLLGTVVVLTMNYREIDGPQRAAGNELPPVQVYPSRQEDGVAAAQIGEVKSTNLSIKHIKPDTKQLKVPASTPSARDNLSPFAAKYRHQYSQNVTLFFNHLETFMAKDWAPSILNRQIFRDDLRAALGETGSIQNFLLTKKNTKLGTKMRYYMFGKPAKITATLWKHLPDDTIYTRGQYKNCSIVGSSGILKGSRCGKKIDKSSYVIRFNASPTKGYEEDVGKNTDFTTLNPSFVRKKLNSLKTKADRPLFDDTVRQFKGSHLWLPAFAVSDNAQIIKQSTEFAKASGLVEPILGHPDHFVSVATLWRKTFNETKTWPSTGLYMISAFFDVCDMINVFGFWPYATALNGSSVPYHFSDNVTATGVHSFDTEFKSLTYLYERGIIKMHLGPCT